MEYCIFCSFKANYYNTVTIILNSVFNHQIINITDSFFNVRVIFIGYTFEELGCNLYNWSKCLLEICNE